MRQLTIAALLAAWVFSAFAEEAPARYRLQVKAYKIDPGAFSATSRIVAEKMTLNLNQQNLQSAEGVNQIDFGQVQVMVMEEGVLWDGEPEPDIAGVTLLGAAEKEVTPERSVEVVMEEERPLQFFQHLRGDLYELKDAGWQGLRMEMELRPEQDMVRLELEATLRLLSEPEQGAKPKYSAAGSLSWATTPPVVSSRTVNGTMLLLPNQWCGVLLPVKDVGAVLLLVQPSLAE